MCQCACVYFTFVDVLGVDGGGLFWIFVVLFACVGGGGSTVDIVVSLYIM